MVLHVCFVGQCLSLALFNISSGFYTLTFTRWSLQRETLLFRKCNAWGKSWLLTVNKSKSGNNSNFIELWWKILGLLEVQKHFPTVIVSIEMHAINTQNPWVNVMCLPEDDHGIQCSSKGWELTVLSRWTSWSSACKAVLELIADCGHPGIWGILRGNGGKRIGWDATHCIAECWSSRQGLSGYTFDWALLFFLLALFPIQARSEDHCLCIATFTFGWKHVSQSKNEAFFHSWRKET